MKTMFEAFDAYLKTLITEAVKQQLTGEAVALALNDGLQTRMSQLLKDSMPQITDLVEERVREYMTSEFDPGILFNDRDFKKGVDQMVDQMVTDSVNNLKFEVKVT